MSSKDELCPHCGSSGYIKYYYLGLSSKVKNWFKTKSTCRKMLCHWREKEHWLEQTSRWPIKKEFWDGQRWVDLQWFWNPNQTWLLPTRCANCKAVISAETIASCEKDKRGVSYVEYSECLETVPCEVKTANGSPLNLALIGHWDAWLPFKTGLRSCGSIEISIANMCKEDRAHVDEVYVVGFVPCTHVPQDNLEQYGTQSPCTFSYVTGSDDDDEDEQLFITPSTAPRAHSLSSAPKRSYQKRRSQPPTSTPMPKRRRITHFFFSQPTVKIQKIIQINQSCSEIKE